MKKTLWLLIIFLNSVFMLTAKNNWNFYLHLPDKTPVLLTGVDLNKTNHFLVIKKLKEATVKIRVDKMTDYRSYQVDVISTENELNAYVSVAKKLDKKEQPYCFNSQVKNSVVYRQSLHEPADHEMTGLAMQPIPMIGVKNNGNYEIAICNSPVFYQNYTTPIFNQKKKTICLSTGDNGKFFSEKDALIVVDSLKRPGTLCVDALIGNLLAQVYLGERLIPKQLVLAHYETMNKYAKTQVGFKTFVIRMALI